MKPTIFSTNKMANFCIVSILLFTTHFAFTDNSVASNNDESRLLVKDLLALNLENSESNFHVNNMAQPELNYQVFGCKIYDANSNCLFCIRDFYLSDGKCQSIPFNQLIGFCNVYSSLTQCYQCDIGYKVSTGRARCDNVGSISNCNRWNLDVCSGCNVGSVLVNGICSIAVANCEVPLQAQLCKLCNDGFNLNELFVCVAVTTPIANCLKYSNNNCIICSKNFALDASSNQCYSASQVNNQIDENCADTVVSTKSDCNICRQGYYLDFTDPNGLKCSSKNPSDESCYVLDFKNVSNCLVCMSGYNMANNQCTKNIELQNKQVDPLAGKASIGMRWVFLSIIALLVK